MKAALTALGLFAGGLAAEAFAWFHFLNTPAESYSGLFFAAVFALHVLGTALFSYGFFAASLGLRFLSPQNWLVTSAAMCFIFPGAGFAFMPFVFLFFWRSNPERSGAYDEYSRYIAFDFAPEQKYMASDQLEEGIGAELEVAPLVDVFGETSSDLRQGAINAIEKLPRKDAVRLLKYALKDKSVEVRYSAAAELSRIEAEFNENVFMARKEVERNPQSATAHLALANGYSEYYESGLLDEYSSGYYRDLAVREYEKALELGGENIHILNYLANIDLTAKRYPEALKKFKRVTEVDPGNVYGQVGLIQAYYEQGKIRDVINNAQATLAKIGETKGPMREIVQYWAS